MVSMVWMGAGLAERPKASLPWRGCMLHRALSVVGAGGAAVSVGMGVLLGRVLRQSGPWTGGRGGQLACDEDCGSEAGRNHWPTRLSRSGSPAAFTESSPNVSDQSHLPLASARSAGIDDSR